MAINLCLVITDLLFANPPILDVNLDPVKKLVYKEVKAFSVTEFQKKV